MQLSKLSIGLGILLMSVLLLVGCTSSGSGTMPTDTNTTKDTNTLDQNKSVYNNLDSYIKVKSGDHIAVNYTGRLENGTVFDSSEVTGRTPLEFDVGAGQMIAGFDTAVIGMKVGEKKTVTIPPEQAYGVSDPQKVLTFDANRLPDFNKLQIGMVLSTTSGYQGTIIAKTDTNATVDFNHELAGKTLIFDITVVSIN